MTQDDDWKILTNEQRKMVNTWRDGVGERLREEAKLFDQEHPGLFLVWELKAGALIRANHPELEPPAMPEKEENMNEETTAALKALRVEINTAIAHAKGIADTHIQRGPGGRELSLAITNMQQARMWTGEALGEIGHKLPEEYRDEAKQ